MRFKSLDTFRGITIALMILVNQAGIADNVYWPLDHAPWTGWTPTDLVFPFFLFAVGMSVSFSFQKPKPGIYGKVFKRFLILFVIGLLINGFYQYDFATIRYLGVLQRIALCYLLISLTVLNLGIGAQVGLSAAILLGYWALMTVVPVPGCGAGVLTRECNFGAWFDRLIIPSAHLYHGDAWNGVGDPEGLFSTLNAYVSGMFGYWAGEWVRRAKVESRAGMDLALAGLAAAGVGKVWGWSFPISKKIWTSSYAVFMGGLALLLFAVCYELNEVRKRDSWSRPFEILGLNGIACFVGSVFFIKVLVKFHAGSGGPSLYDWANGKLFVSWLGAYNGPTLFAVLTVLLWMLVSYGLWRRKIFLKI